MNRTDPSCPVARRRIPGRSVRRLIQKRPAPSIARSSASICRRNATSVPARPREELFRRPLRSPPGSRPAFLARACGDDVALRRQIEALLRAIEGAGTFLDQPSTARPGIRRRATGHDDLCVHGSGPPVDREDR